MLPTENPLYWVQFVCWNQNAISLHLRAIRNTNFAWGGASPNLGQGVEIWGRVWYPMKVHHNGQNLSVDALTLRLGARSLASFGVVVPASHSRRRRDACSG